VTSSFSSFDDFFKSLQSFVGGSKNIIVHDSDSLHPCRGNLPRVDQTLWRLPVLACEVRRGLTTLQRWTTVTFEGFRDTFVRNEETDNKRKYVDALIVSKDKVPFMGRRGFVGIGQKGVREGDIVCVIYGSAFPLVLRRVSDEVDSFTLVGEAFVEGVMDGEAMGMGLSSLRFSLR
jgi:hypothetical protein